MSHRRDSAAVTTAQAHIEAWSNHDFDAARAGLAGDDWVTAHTTDPNWPKAALPGIVQDMPGLVASAQAVIPGSVAILNPVGDDTQALVTLNVRVKFGPEAPEMILPGSRLYLLDDQGKIKVEHVVFFVAPQ